MNEIGEAISTAQRMANMHGVPFAVRENEKGNIEVRRWWKGMDCFERCLPGGVVCGEEQAACEG